MAQAGVYNPTIEQGATFYQEFQWMVKDKDDDAAYVPVDISGYKLRCQMRSSASSSIVIKQLKADFVNAKEGIFSISLSAEETASLPSFGCCWKDYEKYPYDIELVGGNAVIRLIHGVISLSPEVTK